MPDERDAGIDDHAFMKRRGDDRGKLSRSGAVAGTVEEVQDVTGVGFIEAARRAGGLQGVVFDQKGAGLVLARSTVRMWLRSVVPGSTVAEWPLGAVRVWLRRTWPYVRAQLDVPTETLATLGEEISVRETNQLAGQLLASDGQTNLWPDAGRLAGCQDYARERRAQSFVST
jgi:hypothetical protein